MSIPARIDRSMEMDVGSGHWPATQVDVLRSARGALQAHMLRLSASASALSYLIFPVAGTCMRWPPLRYDILVAARDLVVVGSGCMLHPLFAL